MPWPGIKLCQATVAGSPSADGPDEGCVFALGDDAHAPSTTARAKAKRLWLRLLIPFRCPSLLGGGELERVEDRLGSLNRGVEFLFGGDDRDRQAIGGPCGKV